MTSVSRYVFFGKDRDPSLFLEEGKQVPTIQEGEILAKIRLATICGSDMHTISGTRIEAIPSVLGHEAVAEVVETRREDDKVKVGDRITFSVADSCGKCETCNLGLPQKCAMLKKYGHLSLSDVGDGFNGCYASHIVLGPGTSILSIPDHVTDRMAAPINCALATMVNAIEAIPTTRQETAVLQGAGMLGLYGCALLRERGFKHVWCTDTNHDRLVYVPRFGGLPLDASTYRQQLVDGPADDTVDAVIEVCGVRSVINDGLKMLRTGGTYVFVGLVHPNSAVELNVETLIRKCLTFKGIHNYAPRHLAEALRFISGTVSKYPYESLLSPSFPLKDLLSALKLAQTQRYIRVAVAP